MRALVVVLLLVAGCAKPDTGLAPAVQIPSLPENLAQKATQLEPNTDASLKGQILDNTTNIRKYNSVAFQTNKLIEFYNCVRDSINNKKELKCQ